MLKDFIQPYLQSHCIVSACKHNVMGLEMGCMKSFNMTAFFSQSQQQLESAISRKFPANAHGAKHFPYMAGAGCCRFLVRIGKMQRKFASHNPRCSAWRAIRDRAETESDRNMRTNLRPFLSFLNCKRQGIASACSTDGASFCCLPSFRLL